MRRSVDGDSFPTLRRLGPGLLRSVRRLARRAGRTARWTAKALLVLLLVIVVADLALSLVLGRMVAAEIARLKADGYPTTIAEIAPKKVPDAENAADVYARAFKEMGDLDEYGAFSNLMHPEKRTDDATSWAKGMRILERRRPVIALVEQACSRPKCVFPVEWEKGGAALFPHLAKMRGLERLLSADAITKALDGRTGDAVSSLELGIKLSESLAEEPSVISQLVRYAAIQIQAHSLRLVAQHTDIDAARAKRLYDALGAVDLNSGYARAMQTEMVYGLWSFDEFRGDPSVIREYTSFG